MFEGEETVPDTGSGEPASAAVDAADAALDATVEAAVSGTETPAERPSAPARESAAPAREPAQAQRTRDAQGRFTNQPPEPPPAPEEEPVPGPDAPVEPAAEGEEPVEGEQPAPDEAELPPGYPEASYRYEGEDVAIPGTAVGKNGAFIKADAWQDIQQLLALGRSARDGSIHRERSNVGRERQQFEAQVRAAMASRDEIWNAITDMVEAEQRGDTERGFAKFAEDLVGNWAVLKERSRAKGLEVELLETRRQNETIAQEREREQREPQMREAIRGQVAHFGQVAGLSAEAQRTLIDRLNSPRFREQIFIRATEDNPATGVRKGQYLVDYGVIEDEVKFFAQAGGGRMQSTAQRVQQMQRENERRTGKPSTAPPIAPARRGPAPAPLKKLPDTIKTAEQADEFLWDKGGYQQFGG